MNARGAAALAGLLFGLGLVISGMSNPLKVLAFLDLRGAWDPSLLVVMAAATVTTFLGYRWAWRREAPLAEPRFDLPTRRDIDAPLVLGAALFGLGWGLAGYCPGPALTALVLVPGEGALFVGAMVVGMILARTLRARRTRG